MRRCDEIAKLALKGDRFAVEYLIAYYDDYINSLCRVTTTDINGTRRMYLDISMKAELQASIIHLLQSFSIEKAIAAMEEVDDFDP